MTCLSHSLSFLKHTEQTGHKSYPQSEAARQEILKHKGHHQYPKTFPQQYSSPSQKQKEYPQPVTQEPLLQLQYEGTPNAFNMVSCHLESRAQLFFN